MRSVKPKRSARSGGRAKTDPARARIQRIKEPRESFGRRARRDDTFVTRFVRRVLDWIIVRRPLLTITGALFLFVVVAALFVGGYVGRSIHSVERGFDALVADAGFGIAEVHLAGNVRTPPETVLAALGFAPGQSIFGADLQAARQRLMALDWVADAEVERRYPDSISVRIVEKKPFALWQSPQGPLYIVARNGSVITSKNVAAYVRLPLLIGAGANRGADIIGAVRAHRATLARVRAIERVSERRWNLILDDGVVVKLPETDWRRQLDTLEHLIIDKGILERDVAEIDLRSKSHFFFVLKGAQKQAKDRGSRI